MSKQRLHPVEETDRRARVWQIVVVITLFVSYGCNYFTRNHFFVTISSFRHYLDPNDSNNAQKWLGIMLTAGQFSFLTSKVVCAFLIDTWLHSGVQPIAFGLIMVPVLTSCTAFFTISEQSSRIMFCIVMWTLVSACQAPQWSGVMKTVANWIEYQYYGRVLSFLSVSFLAGDAITRWVFAYVLTFERFSHWQPMCYFGSVMTIIAVIPLIILVKDSPEQRGLPMPRTRTDPKHCERSASKSFNSPELSNHMITGKVSVELSTTLNTYHSVQYRDDMTDMCLDPKHATAGAQSKSWILLQPVLKNRLFCFLLILNFCLTTLRTFFMMYCADYLVSVVGSSEDTAAFISGLFPAMGAISAPLNGVWVDKMLHNKSSAAAKYILLPIQGVVFTLCIAVMRTSSDISIETASGCILFSGFGILGCYTTLFVISLDIGGTASPTIASGMGDAAGLVGGMSIALISGFFEFSVLLSCMIAVGCVYVVSSTALCIYVSCRRI